MKFYKIITDDAFIGAVHSGQFVTENGVNHKLFFSNEITGQYVSYDGALYRDYWMSPIQGTVHPFASVHIIEITSSEYETFIEAIENNKPINIVPEDEIIPDPVPVTDTDVTIEFMRESKINEMSATCRRVIEAGIDIELRMEIHHFSLNTQDQLNIMSLGVMAQTQALIPYHADGEVCIFYTAEEIQ